MYMNCTIDIPASGGSCALMSMSEEPSNGDSIRLSNIPSVHHFIRGFDFLTFISKDNDRKW